MFAHCFITISPRESAAKTTPPSYVNGNSIYRKRILVPRLENFNPMATKNRHSDKLRWGYDKVW